MIWDIVNGLQVHRCKDSVFELYFSRTEHAPMLSVDLTEEVVSHCPFCGIDLRAGE